MSDTPNVVEAPAAAADLAGTPTVIAVVYEAEPPKLEIVPAQASVTPGTPVLWDFRGLPEGYVPLVHFESGAPGTFDPGPFSALCLSADGITGVVASGATGDWPYQLLLHPVPGFGVGTLDYDVPPANIMIPTDPRDGQDG